MRGEKFCSTCKGRNGPRAFQCVHCGKGFIVKGQQQPDVNPADREAEAKETRQTGLDRTERKRLLALVETCRERKEAATRIKFYGKKSKTFQSLCGKYRIRYCPEFMGVSVKLDDNRPFSLLKLTTFGWEPVNLEKYRFKKLWTAIKTMVAFQQGKLPKQHGGVQVMKRRKK